MKCSRLCTDILRFVCLGLLLPGAGCTTISEPAGPPAPSFKTLTGNWEFALQSAKGPAPTSALGGFVLQGNVTGPSGYSAQASLQVEEPSSCFVGTNLIPFLGQLKGQQLGLYSFAVYDQYIDTSSTVNATGTEINGTYVVQGGCAGDMAEAGTLVGTRYQPLNGTYTGTLAVPLSPASVAIEITQSAQGQGDGSSRIAGSAAFSNSSCLNGTFSVADSYVIGKQVFLHLVQQATGSIVDIDGTFDPAADTINAPSVSISNNTCGGDIGAATFVN